MAAWSTSRRTGGFQNAIDMFSCSPGGRSAKTRIQEISHEISRGTLFFRMKNGASVSWRCAPKEGACVVWKDGILCVLRIKNGSAISFETDRASTRCYVWRSESLSIWRKGWVVVNASALRRWLSPTFVSITGSVSPRHLKSPHPSQPHHGRRDGLVVRNRSLRYGGALRNKNARLHRYEVSLFCQAVLCSLHPPLPQELFFLCAASSTVDEYHQRGLQDELQP